MKHGPKILLAVLGATVLAGVAGCASGFPPGSGGPATSDCTPGVMRITNLGAIGVIHGLAHVHCEGGVPKRYTSYVTLQREIAGNWEDQGQGSSSTEIPTPDAEYAFSATCVAGNWRVLIHVTGTSSTGTIGGGTAFSESVEIKDCSTLFHSGPLHVTGGTS